MHLVSADLFPTDSSPELEPDFKDFYRLYPAKIGRQKALAAWAKLGPGDKRQAIDALPDHLAHWRALDWYTPPHPASWLNGRRWEDELPKALQPCAWPACRHNAAEGHNGMARYCQTHQGALARGETPGRR